MTASPDTIKAARTEWRRRQIVAAATRLLATRGFHEMSVSDLAVEADISVGTIYQYVDNKEGVLLLVIQDILDAYRMEVPSAMSAHTDPLEKVYAGFGAYCRVVDSRMAGTLLAYRESRTLGRGGLAELKRLEEETTGFLIQSLRDCVESTILCQHDSETVGWDLSLLAHMWSLKRWHFGTSMTVDEYIKLQFSVIMAGLVRKEVHSRYEHLIPSRDK